MAKKYSSGAKTGSLSSLSQRAGTPYGQGKTKTTTTATTFNVAPVTPTSSPRKTTGKTIKDYVSNPSANMPGATCNPKHIIIQSGEYVAGSFNLGVNNAGSFISGNSYGAPVAIDVSKYVTNPTGAVDSNFESVIGVSDVGGWYKGGITAGVVSVAASSFANGSPHILTGSNVTPSDSKFTLVYHADDLRTHGMVRQIKVDFSDSTSKTFDVLIPGYKNTMGIGDSLAQIGGPDALSNLGEIAAQNCETCPGLTCVTAGNDSFGHGQAYANNNINGGLGPFFTGYGTQGTGNKGIYKILTTDLGAHHDNAGLWAEGYQPDDSGNSLTSTGNMESHQETWPRGYFLHNPHFSIPPIDRTINFYTSNFGATGIGGTGMHSFYDLMYDSSSIVNTTHPNTSAGHPLLADSTQHYKALIINILHDTAHGIPNWNFIPGNEYYADISGTVPLLETTQPNYVTWGTWGTTNTSDDGGYHYNKFYTELEQGEGDYVQNPANSYGSVLGGTSPNSMGWINTPTSQEMAPHFSQVQVFTEDLDCHCNTPVNPPKAVIDICTDTQSTNYYLYTGHDCAGNPVPTDLMDNTATWGQSGCTACDYELPAAGLSVCTKCKCDSNFNDFPQWSAVGTAPTSLGGNDGYGEITINPAHAGTGPWWYIITPNSNTSAGLGVGAVHTLTVNNAGSGLLNGVTEFEYTSGSTAGTKLRVRAYVDTGTVQYIDTIHEKGSEYVLGETLTFTQVGGSGTFTADVIDVKGVTISIQGTGTSSGVNTWKENPHEGSGGDATASNGLIATLGTNIMLAHKGGPASTNNYGVNPRYGWGALIDGGTGNQESIYNNVPGMPFVWADYFWTLGGDTSDATGITITGMEAGQYAVTVVEDINIDTEKAGCFYSDRLTIPPGVNNNYGCTDNNTGTNDGAALNYDAAAAIDDNSCIYCRAADGKLVDYQSVELPVSGSSNPGDILTSAGSSHVAIAATTSVAADGSLEVDEEANTIMDYYYNQIKDAGNSVNALYKMQLYKRASSAQTLVGATPGCLHTNLASVGFHDIWTNGICGGLTYGYYAVKFWVDDPDADPEAEQCYQVRYYTVPVLACLIGPPSMQVGITTDGVTINDLNLIVNSIPNNPTNPCAAQCCDTPILSTYNVPANSTPGCFTPAFKVDQSCPNGIESYVTSVTHDIEFFDGVNWNVIQSQVVATPSGPTQTYNYTVSIYNAYGPGDYRVTTVLDLTFPGGVTTQCLSTSNDVNLNVDVCGCTDPAALNYDASAVIDDGSCIYCVYGCMDPNATNYNPLATCDDGSCLACVYGCMDPSSTNYNPMATCDDGSCQYGGGCGCTDIMASNYGYDCAGNLVGYPPPCDDGCCLYGGGNCGGNAPLLSNVNATDNTCPTTCINNAGCNSNLTGISGGPGYFKLNVDFGLDKGVAIFTFNTGHSNKVTAPLKESVPDAMKITFDGVTKSEYSSLVGGYLTGLVGSPGNMCSSVNSYTMPIHGCNSCADGYDTANMPNTGLLDVYEFDNTSQTFVQTFNQQQISSYGATSTGDITVSMWPRAGATPPNIGQTPHYPTTFSQTSHFNRNGVAYISVPPNTTASKAEIVVEAPCSSTWWGINMSCPALLTSITASSASAGVGASNATVDAFALDTQYYHIPVDAAGATNPNSTYWQGTGSGVGQQAGVLGKHDWIFTDAYAQTPLPAGCYKMTSEGQNWNVTVGVPSYNDDVHTDTPPSGPTKDGIVLMMEGPL